MSIWLHAAVLLMGSIVVIARALRGQSLWPTVALACLISIYIRAIHHVPDHAYMYHDGLFYFSVTESIIQTHALEVTSDLANWYPGASQLMEWPAMNIITTAIIVVTGVSPQMALQYLPPLSALPFLLLTWAVYRLIVGDQLGLIAAYTTMMLDTMIYYQIQYHQQGFAILFVVFILWFIIRHTDLTARRSSILTVSIGIGSILAHRFTGGVIILLLFLIVSLGVIWKFLLRYSLDYTPTTVRMERLARYTIIIGVIGILIHLFLSPGFTRSAIMSITIALLEGAPPAPSSPGSISGKTMVTDHFPVMIKFVVTALAIPTILSGLTGRESSNVEWLALATVSVGLLALPIVVLAIKATPRLVMIGYLPLMGLTFVTLQRLRNFRWLQGDLPIGTLAIASVALMIILMGATAGSIPSHIDHKADLRSDGYHGITPIGDQAPVAGTFINRYGDDDMTYAVTFWTRMIPLYYGESSNVIFVNSSDSSAIGVYDTARQTRPPSDIGNDSVYDNGRIVFVENTSSNT